MRQFIRCEMQHRSVEYRTAGGRVSRVESGRANDFGEPVGKSCTTRLLRNVYRGRGKSQVADFLQKVLVPLNDEIRGTLFC